MSGPLAPLFAQVREESALLADWAEEPLGMGSVDVDNVRGRLLEALSAIERHVQDMAERLDDFEHSLSNWEAAYPTSVFGDDLTKEEQRAVTDALVGAGFTSDRVHASWGRHIVRCFTEAFAPVRAALPAREKEEE